MTADSIWQTIVRSLAVIGFAVTLIALMRGIPVPWGFFVLLIGMFFGPDVYRRIGPGAGG